MAIAIAPDADGYRAPAGGTHYEKQHATRRKTIRVSARRVKAVDQPDADAIGDYWLLVADLYDINRAGLSVEERRRQAVPLLEAYVIEHDQAAPTPAVLRNLDQVRAGGDTQRARVRLLERMPAAPDADPAPPAPATDAKTNAPASTTDE